MLGTHGQRRHVAMAPRRSERRAAAQISFAMDYSAAARAPAARRAAGATRFGPVRAWVE